MKNRKNITEIRAELLRYLLNRDGSGAVNTLTLERAVNSNNLTIKPQLDWLSRESPIRKIIVEDKIVGWELNTELLGFLSAVLEDCDMIKSTGIKK